MIPALAVSRGRTPRKEMLEVEMTLMQSKLDRNKKVLSRQYYCAFICPIKKLSFKQLVLFIVLVKSIKISNQKSVFYA